jgi:hypothetical protein
MFSSKAAAMVVMGGTLMGGKQNMEEFRSKSWMNYTAYGWIYVGTIISIACYAADL